MASPDFSRPLSSQTLTGAQPVCPSLFSLVGDDYMVSCCGTVYSKRFWRGKTGWYVLKPSVSRTGKYPTVNIYGKHKLVHRLVAELYVPNTLSNPIVHHRDNNKNNTCAVNLEWTDNASNIRQAYNDGKITRPMRRIVQQTDSSGVVIAEYAGTWEAERATGIDRSSIAKVARGVKSRHQAGGFGWRYKGR